MISDSPSDARQSNNEVPPRQGAIPLRPVLLRAGVVALVIGSALTLINQAAALFGTARLDILPLALVYVTPFVVVAISQFLGIRQAVRDLSGGSSGHFDEAFWATMTGHGIPFRALLTGLAAGGVNTSVTLTGELLAGGGRVDTLPLALIAQACMLPILFGALSQALSYRRAVAARAALSPS